MCAHLLLNLSDSYKKLLLTLTDYKWLERGILNLLKYLIFVRMHYDFLVNGAVFLQVILQKENK